MFRLLDPKRKVVVLRQTSGESLNMEINEECGHFCAGISFTIYTDRRSTHTTTLVYRASLAEIWTSHAVSYKQFQYWKQFCLKYACYIWPVSPSITTWYDANEECERRNASLLSINSDVELSLVATLSHEGFIYIGLKIKVSRNLMT